MNAMKELTVYTFDNSDGDADSFETMNFEEAKEYAQENNLKIIENTYEWQERFPCFGQDYTVTERERPSTVLPEIGAKVVLKEIEIGMMQSLPAGYTGVVTAIDDQIIVVKVDQIHEVLSEWDNEVIVHVDFLGDDFLDVTDPKERLAMAFWDNVESVIDGRVEAGT